ncbi:MAG TPA: vitamin B12-dependent ribonucleotide reductase [Spirochaetota bacterium]|nr:vitamin B12-dependent ribonucleotide reductase [Spirochaetota bacterium]HPC42735.1 vitamin B12-dependent ribonucleotide reductase [Spirochaetota bacterium]HPL18147.1 vitamin B12-dependent ribonucleotide reductase [Spirochaetota bacterium]HQF08359.1 vitamin B12-dependent ribonucleotide reductase [Spirochaetota bacterium]HQH98996.1 vitamin B12-dependent ribonucleotide reductase [Spirochaetota bacterium]
MEWTDIIISSKKEPRLSDNARLVLEKRYLAKDDKGNIIETPVGLFKRVAMYVASADLIYGKPAADVNRLADEFYDMMVDLQFLPNTPTLMNAGRPLGQLSACFVLPVEDSMDKIFDAVKNMALIHKSGGGTGFSFSRLRPKDDIVKSTAGVSSGPVSFMNIFNAATETVKQGGTRRGANMAILSVNHPDIIDFVRAKEDTNALTNFNISVALTDEFMDALERGGDYPLINPNTKQVSSMLNAREVFNLIVRKAWESGEPGIIFIDRINAANPLKKIGMIESTNPCGEQPLLPFESCNLGSINLNTVIKKQKGSYVIDYDKLRQITRMAVRFLDNIIDLNRYPLDLIKENTLANRKIGLGIMGFADVLIRMGIPYNSDDAVTTAESIMAAIQEESKRASEELARERGAFPNFSLSSYADNGHTPLRNATTTTIAPTGTISIIAGTSSGIEPIYALAYLRNVMDNNILVEANPLFEETAREQGFRTDDIMTRIAEHGSASGVDGIPEDIQRIFVSAHDISPEWHIRIQAAFQKHVDNAVSKTVNFRADATMEEIEQVYLMAYHLGCKGVTVYRDQSRENQVLETRSRSEKRPSADDEKAAAAVQGHITPRPRSEITWGATRKMATGCGSLYVTINQDEQGLFEVFAAMGKGGGCAASQTEAVSRLISLALRSGIDKEQIIKQIKGVRCPNQAWEKGGRIYSCADAIAKALERHSGITPSSNPNETIHEAAKNIAETNGKIRETVMVGVCPDCHGPLEFESGCSVCRACGFSRCG